VVLPARVADVELGIGSQPADEIGAELQSSRAAERLHGNDAAFLERRALETEDDFLDGTVIRLQAVDRQVVARQRLLRKLLLRLAHALEHRHLALVVGVHADAKVDLVRVRIGVKGFGDAQDRVGGRHFHGGEE
jgi:hypothetical protein